MHSCIFPIVAVVTFLAMSPVLSYRTYRDWFIAIVSILAIPISAFPNQPTPAHAVWLLAGDAVIIVCTLGYRRRPHGDWPSPQFTYRSRRGRISWRRSSSARADRLGLR